MEDGARAVDLIFKTKAHFRREFLEEGHLHLFSSYLFYSQVIGVGVLWEYHISRFAVARWLGIQLL